MTFEDVMLAQLNASSALPKTLNATHLLVLLPKGKTLPRDVPQRDLLAAVLKRRGMKVEEFADASISANAGDGGMIAWAMLDFSKSTFALQTQVRKALQLLLGEYPSGVAIVVQGNEAQRRQAAEAAVYAAWVNGAPLPLHKKKADQRKPLQKIALYGFTDTKSFAALKAQAEGNLLCRTLTVLPPNELTPGQYRKRIKELAKQQGWQIK